MIILVLNAGSSSLKHELFESRGLKSLFQGHFDNHGKAITNFEKIVRKVIRELPLKNGELKIDAIGHRVVHGGEKYTEPIKITARVLREIKKLSALAPLHNPPNVAGIEACQKLFPNVPQIAVFDTAFHQTMPERAYLYGLPYSYYTKGK
ncbi:acetate kinase, partial [Candidatus Peregrinibacteria bacterium CG11_big_fil_rev_8_21_14_0_20_46_8]